MAAQAAPYGREFHQPLYPFKHKGSSLGVGEKTSRSRPIDQEHDSSRARDRRLLLEGDVVASRVNWEAAKPGSPKDCPGSRVEPKTIVTSPSFTLVNEYQGRAAFYHMDVYRWEAWTKPFQQALKKPFTRRGGRLEWADRWPEILPEHTDGQAAHPRRASPHHHLSGRHPERTKSLDS